MYHLPTHILLDTFINTLDETLELDDLNLENLYLSRSAINRIQNMKECEHYLSKLKFKVKRLGGLRSYVREYIKGCREEFFYLKQSLVKDLNQILLV